MTLRQLEQRGHVRSVRRRIVIRDTAALRALAFQAQAPRRGAKISSGTRVAAARRAAAMP
jgi:hypothetical protein